MRVGFNPHKDQQQEESEYLHQIIIPVYIPNQDEYFKDSFSIFKLCISSLFATIHNKTFITIVNNGSGSFVKEYLNELLEQNKIHEVIHVQNIGKLNAILKGLAGNNIELVTITDADVLFLDNWQNETTKVFRAFPKAGVVGIVPQFNMFKNKCGNIILDNLFNKNLKFIPINSTKGLIRFYDSIGWDKSYNKDYLKFSLGLEKNEIKVFVGSGHFVATYKKQMFNELKLYLNYKLGGGSEEYLDMMPLKYDYWRVTTYDNYAYHMGNVYEDWMFESKHDKNEWIEIDSNFTKHKLTSTFKFKLKNIMFTKVLLNDSALKLFYKWKKLPKSMVNNFNNIIPK
ncbi:glycosyltransferase family A protein [Flavobacterium sp. WC2430]|uniref:glycosyltransferase family A protein n=1 Tax=Flavobacterium sp. WC2430 TaxID=3234137 RepID=UPI003465EEAB